ATLSAVKVADDMTAVSGSGNVQFYSCDGARTLLFTDEENATMVVIPYHV
nr:hypothetical protein [Tanacetum cinerariifolium]